MSPLLRVVLALLLVASGLPVCRCTDHAGEECRPIGGATANEPAAHSCCGGERAPEEKAPARPSGGGCCCLDAPAPDPTAVPPAGLASLVADATHPHTSAASFLAPAPLVPPLEAIAASRTARSPGHASARSAPDVPLYRLHAALLI